MPADQPPPPPPTPDQKLQQVAPDMAPETLERYSEKLTELEQRTGIPVQDPTQLQKFIKEMEKVDKKVIDQEMKAMGEEMQAELGGGQQAKMTSTTMPGGQPQQPPAGSQGAQPSGASMQKVALAARRLARAFNR